MVRIKYLQYYLVIILLASLFYVPLTGRVHLFDWDEVNFAESAREMIESGDYLTVQINYKAFWEKPPLFIWAQVISMKLFGVNEFAARFPNALAGIITLLSVFSIGTKLKNERFGAFWALSHGASVLPLLYFKSGIIDPWFNYFIFMGIYFAYQFYKKSTTKNIILSAVFVGLSVLTKGPVGFLIFGLTGFVFLLFIRFKVKVTFLQIVYFLTTFAFVGGFWFILLIMKGHGQIITDFIHYQIELFQTKDAGHGGFPLYHVVILLLGMFPASVFAIKPLFSVANNSSEIKDFNLLMKILFFAVLILFSIVKTKIVHYSSMCYFPLAYLSAYFLYEKVGEQKKSTLLQNVLFYLISVLFFIIAALLPIAGKNKDWLIQSGYIKDSFVLGNLQALVTWTGFEAVIVVFLLLTIFAYAKFNKRKNEIKSIYLIYGSLAVFIFTFLVFNIKKVEGISQRTPIAFYKSKQSEDCYLKTIKYKSYAPYFYGELKPPENKSYYNDQWLLRGNIDKPVYFVSRVMHRGAIEKMAKSDLQFIEEKNGFLFHKRLPQK